MLAHGQAGLPKATPTGTGRIAGYAAAGWCGMVLGRKALGLVWDGIGREWEDAFQPLNVTVKGGWHWVDVSIVGRVIVSSVL